MYTLFKKLYRKRIEKDLRDILGYYEFVGTEDESGTSQSMSWETFMRQLFR